MTVVVGRALDRHQAIRLPDFFGVVCESERRDEQDLDRDIDARLDSEAIAVGPECYPVLTDGRPVAEGAKAQVTMGRAVGAEGTKRPEHADRRCGRGQSQEPSAGHVGGVPAGASANSFQQLGASPSFASTHRTAGVPHRHPPLGGVVHPGDFAFDSCRDLQLPC